MRIEQLKHELEAVGISWEVFMYEAKMDKMNELLNTMTTTSGVLFAAFQWSKTFMGYDYWCHKHSEIERLEKMAAEVIPDQILGDLIEFFIDNNKVGELNG